MKRALPQSKGTLMSLKKSLWPLLTIGAFSLTSASRAQTWNQVDLINFNNLVYESNYTTNGSAYYENFAPPPAGPRNGLINGVWEVTNTNLGSTQSPSDASGGRFLMYWTDNTFSASAPAGIVFSKTYTGLTIGRTYRYSFKYGFLVQTGSAVSNVPVLTILRDGGNSQSVAAATTTWATATITFIATATSHTLAINNTQTGVNGNDFGLDDIKLEVQQVALPILLSAFEASASKQGTDLSWETQSAQNAKGFEIQVSSDCDNWERVDFVPVYKANSIEAAKYSYHDPQQRAGVSYYRLKLTDLDNSFEYSLVRKVEQPRDYTVSAFPNPVRGELNIAGLQAGDEIRIFGLGGRMTGHLTATGKTMKINTHNWSTGMYMLSISGTERRYTLKVFKE